MKKTIEIMTGILQCIGIVLSIFLAVIGLVIMVDYWWGILLTAFGMAVISYAFNCFDEY